VDVLVEIEGGDHHDGQRILDLRPGELAGGFDAVDVGHADVEQAHVRPEPAGERHRRAAVSCLTDDLDVGLRVEDHPEPGSDDLLIVGKDDSDRHEPPRPLGSTACTVHPRFRFGPASRVPPSSFARSAIPISPNPDAERGSKEPASPSSPTVSRTQSSSPLTVTWMRVARRAWRTALVIDSCASR